MAAGRKADPLTKYRMRCHIANGYRYGATLSTAASAKGNVIRRYIHWGNLSDDLVFSPNLAFVMMDVDERKKYVFPKEWNIDAVKQLNAASEKARPVQKRVLSEKKIEEPITVDPNDACLVAPCELKPEFDSKTQYNNRLYGHVWFLMELARKEHLLDDLLVTFDYNREIVDNVLTLAIFPYLTGWSFHRLAQWQKYTKTPSEKVLTSPIITRFTQSITDHHRMTFCKLRIERLKPESVAACDSTMRSGWGRCLADIRWGKNKDNAAIKNTLEVVVYSLTTHEPIYYRSFPGNMMDQSTVRTIIQDLKALGITDVIIIFDRDYASDANMLRLAQEEIPFLMCIKIGQEPALDCVMKIRYDKYGMPKNMKYCKETETFYTQMDASDIMLTAEDGSQRKISGLKVNLFMEMKERTSQLMEIQARIEYEETEWEKRSAFMKLESISKEQVKTINKDFRYHRIVLTRAKKNREGEIISPQSVSFVSNDKILEKERAIAGFYSSVSYKTPGDALEQSQLYETRDEQEKYFDQIENPMGFDMQDCSSEDGKSGRLFTSFVGLILSTKITSTWKSNEELKKRFSTTHEMVEEMTPIRYVDYPNEDNHITSFLAPQVYICDAFGIEVPPECLSPAEQK